MRIIVFGAGEYGKTFINCCSGFDEIVAVADNYFADTSMFGHKVIKPSNILDFDFDKVIIALSDRHNNGVKTIVDVYEQLMDMGVPRSKILLNNVLAEMLPMHKIRANFLNSLRTIERETAEPISGKLAEVGVYRGDFAAVINRLYPEKELYLFDTFEGFDERDINVETSSVSRHWLATGGASHHAQGSELLSLLRCPHYEQVAVKRGYVPDTLVEVENEKFCFVNIDLDLYAPTLAALKFFMPRMVERGVILLHDYFSVNVPGIKQAVDDFDVNRDIVRFPIGDNYSIALLS